MLNHKKIPNIIGMCILLLVGGLLSSGGLTSLAEAQELETDRGQCTNVQDNAGQPVQEIDFRAACRDHKGRVSVTVVREEGELGQFIARLCKCVDRGSGELLCHPEWRCVEAL